MKDDNWSHNWGNGIENIKIPNHHTTRTELNTINSLLAVIDGTPPYGHIFWSYNPVKKEVDHEDELFIKLLDYCGTDIGYITYEQPAPQNSLEFIKNARSTNAQHEL